MKQRIRNIVWVLLAVFALLTAGYLSFRNNVLRWGIQQATRRMAAETDAVLAINSAAFSGLSTIQIQGLSVTPAFGDTLLRINTMDLRFSLWTMLVGTIRIKEITGSGIDVSVTCNDSICNYTGFIHEKAVTTSRGTKNYALLLKRNLDRIFNLAPQRALLENLSFTYRNNGMTRRLAVKSFRSDENSLQGVLEDLDSGSSWECTGRFSQTHHLLALNVYPTRKTHSLLPLVGELTGIYAGFDSVHVSLDRYSGSRDHFRAEGDFYIKGLFAFHKKLSDDTIRVPFASFAFRFNAEKNALELDSSSAASLDSISFIPYVRYSSNTEKEYNLHLNTAVIPATDFFSSLPEGIFDEVREITADGNLRFGMNFRLNSARPDEAAFDAFLVKDKFKIKNTGPVNLFKLNNEFTQNVFEKGRLVRSFQVGPSNPYYAPLDSISHYFIHAVMTSEDGNFYSHNGFNEEAFRKSIAANYKAGKFVRGGSTISMQLVKNVYLNSRKTIARKAEEALLVWLIESNRLFTKQRMLEVYLNIIELGPGVYGIGEASSFYFSKKPAELDLAESIFLASLLPRPKGFMHSFDSLGNLKPQLADYYRVVSDFMLKKNLISETEHARLVPRILLKGQAREMVLPADTVAPAEEETY